MLHLEDLVLLDRQRSYERLLEHLRIDSEPRCVTFFEDELTPERAHLGRWRAGLDTEERDATDAAYQASPAAAARRGSRLRAARAIARRELRTRRGNGQPARSVVAQKHGPRAAEPSLQSAA